MEKIGENLWVHQSSMKLGGTDLPLRTTLVQLTNGDIWVHSPTELSADLRSGVEALGKVSYIVAASNGHNLWLKSWQSAYPDAKLVVAAGVPGKLDLSGYELLDAEFANPWEDDLVHQFLSGVPFFCESVFLHTRTRSLIVTDFVQHHADVRPAGFAGFMTRFVLEPIGFKGICIAPPLKFPLVMKDREAVSRALANVNQWEFDRIIVTHGDIIEDHASSIFSDLFARFLN